MRYLALLVLFSVASASAQTRPTAGQRQGISVPHSVDVELYGPITTTPISGSNGTNSVSVSTDQPNQFLTQLEFYERSDDPCFMQAGYGQVVSGAVSMLSSRESFRPQYASSICWNNGSGNPGSRMVATARRPTPIDGYESFAAVHGIEMCSNDRNENNYKLKGVRVLVTHLNADGRGDIVRSPSFGDEFARTNCSKWEGPRYCPVGNVAVGINVHYASGSFTGLALRCQAIRMTPIRS